MVSLTKELEEFHVGGNTDEELSALKKLRNEMEFKLKDQVRSVKVSKIIDSDN